MVKFISKFQITVPENIRQQHHHSGGFSNQLHSSRIPKQTIVEHFPGKRYHTIDSLFCHHLNCKLRPRYNYRKANWLVKEVHSNRQIQHHDYKVLYILFSKHYHHSVLAFPFQLADSSRRRSNKEYFHSVLDKQFCLPFY